MLRDFPVTGRLDAAAGPGRTAPARPSASVLLVTDAPTRDPGGVGGLEVFTFRRIPGMAFAPGMVVFPGGAVDEGDHVLADRGPPGLTARHVAAVRETFEECGVLLAAGPADGRVPDRVVTHLPDLREDLLAGRITWAGLLEATGTRLDPGLLHPWARWVTPLVEPRRFDTTFFVAALPPGQNPGSVDGEGEDARWRDPAQALTDYRAGRLALMPPTLVCLEDLAAARDVRSLLDTPRIVRPVCPRVVLPDDRGDGRPSQDDPSAVVRVDLDGRGGGDGPVEEGLDP